jgi:arginine/lysine/ornithine decarboxylase
MPVEAPHDDNATPPGAAAIFLARANGFVYLTTRLAVPRHRSNETAGDGGLCDQHRAPLFEASLRFADALRAPFYSPGHKGGRSLPAAFRERLAELDLNNLPDTDTLACPTGPILEAERLLAGAYGVRRSFILVGGSTSGNIAAVLASCNPGDELLVQRNAHKSTIAGIILAGVKPVWLFPDTDPLFGIQHGVSAEALAQALDEHPNAVGTVVLNPTYHGSVPDIAALGEVTRRRNKLLLVDEAHGPHFHFHPDLPVAAEDVGADLVVQSTHKVLSGLSQAAVLHAGTDRVDEARIRRALNLTQTTSPSFPVMASIDLARREMALEGRMRWEAILELSREARARLSQIPEVRILERDPVAKPGAGFFSLEQTKIVFGLPELMSGTELQRILNREHGVHPELAGRDYVLCILTIGSCRADVDRLVDAVTATVRSYREGSRTERSSRPLAALARSAAALRSCPPEIALLPRDAHFAPNVAVRLEETAGRVSAEVVTPYPPGIPVLMPGERITRNLVTFLLDIRAAALPVSVSDPSLERLLVIR